MKARRILTAILLVLLVLIAGMIWVVTQYHIVGLKLYPKHAETVDLRGQEITYSHYDAVREKLPEAEILWDVPFQGGSYANDTKIITVKNLTAEDVTALGYFTQLETLKAEECRDYDQLMAFRQNHPEVEILFKLEVGGKTFDQDTREMELSAISQEEIALLPMLQKLETVTVSSGGTAENMVDLQAYCHANGCAFRVSFDGVAVEDGAQEVSITNATTEDLYLLQLLSNMKQLELTTPKAPVEALLALQEAYPDVEVSWSQEVAGKLFSHTETLIDISNIEVTDLDAVAQAMTYFPDATQLEMHFCGVENEDMAAFREAHREDYKVVWTVYLGPLLPTRTDTTSIMPARDGTSVFHDEEAYNMRYCEDVIAVDVGHLDVRNVEWAVYMPHLKYLILAWTGVQDLSPLGNCKELVWLEVDNSPAKESEALLGCTALEDINIGNSSMDGTVLSQMTWLKNVWAIGKPMAAYRVAQGCPDAHVVTSGEHTVSGGWRYLPNYYAMRDALNMFYMDQ